MVDLVSTLVIVNIAVSALSPLVTAISSFISHIRKSNCCGGSVELEVADIRDEEKEKSSKVIV